MVYGDLEDGATLEEEASKADIVLHFASSDHVGAASSIKQGMEKGAGGYWIHTSGTDILLNPKILSGGRDDDGEVKVYNDWENVEELMSFPGITLSRVRLCNVDRLTKNHRSTFSSPLRQSRSLALIRKGQDSNHLPAHNLGQGPWFRINSLSSDIRDCASDPRERL